MRLTLALKSELGWELNDEKIFHAISNQKRAGMANTKPNRLWVKN